MRNRRISRPYCGRAARLRWLATSLLVASLLLAAPVQAQSGGAMRIVAYAFEVPVRLLTGMQLVAGSALFVPAAMLSFPGPVIASRSIKDGKTTVLEALDIFVTEPYERTFTRPLAAF
jgi:hypothetical protein